MALRVAKQADNTSEIDHRALGLEAVREKRWIEAAGHLESAAEASPEDLEVLIALAQANEGLADAKSARSWYAKAVKVDPKCASALLGLARLLARDGRMLDAAGYACGALESDPANAQAASLIEALRPKVKATKPAPKKGKKPVGPTREDINSVLRRINSALAGHRATNEQVSAERPTLSLCMIAKDEERFIEECLRSVQGLATEMIVVDTGSSDRTAEIASSLGASVHKFKWNDSFSDAKNSALDHATGEWVLVLDADERLDKGAADTIARAMNSGADAFELLFHNYSGDGPNADFGTHRTCRLFRNRPEFRYKGRVHEAIVPAIKAAGGTVEKLDAIVHHFGYKPEIIAERGKHERYIRLLEADLAQSPDDVRCLYNLGQTCSAAGETEKAVQYLERAAEVVDPAEEFFPAAVYHTYASCLLVSGVPDQALALVEKADGLGIKHPELSFVRGSTLAMMRRFSEAIIHYQVAIKMGSGGSYVGDASTWGYRAFAAIAKAYVALADYRRAAENCEKAVQLKPDDFQSQELLAQIYSQLMGPKAYERHLLKVQHSMPRKPEAAALLGEYYLGNERYADARAQFERAIELGGESADIRACLGQCHVAQGKFAAAQENFEQALKLDAACAGAFHGIGLILAAEGRAGDALDAFVKALECNPTYGPAYAAAGDLLASLGNYAKAADLYQNAIQCDPEDPDLFTMLGDCFLAMKAPEAATLAFRQALTLDGEHKQGKEGMSKAEAALSTLKAA